MYALVVFVVMDYFTGVLAAGVKKELSSEVGFKGIAKKVCIFVLVGIANIVDTQVIMTGRRSVRRSSSFIWRMRGFLYWKTAQSLGCRSRRN